MRRKQDCLNYAEIGKNIRYFRQRAGLKQNELSDIIDMSPQHISHIESGEPLSLSTLVQIANTLRVDADCLLGSNLREFRSDDLREELMRRTKNFSKLEGRF